MHFKPISYVSYSSFPHALAWSTLATAAPARAPGGSFRACATARKSQRARMTQSASIMAQVGSRKPLTIGIVGFGNFGQFLGKEFARQGHRVIGFSRGDYAAAAARIECEYVRDANVLMDAAPEVVILCTSIMSLHIVLSKFPTARLVNTLVVDVLSVKMYAHDLMLRMLPPTADILCTHPMFGPESGKVSWEGLPFVYDIVRVSPDCKPICDTFLQIWKKAQCRMVPMTCEEHDQYAASSQFITHTTGRMLKELDVSSTPINTTGYESLLGVVDTTCKDSFELFYGLYKYNPNSRNELDKLETALKNLRYRLEEAEKAEALDSKKSSQRSGVLSANGLHNDVLEKLRSRETVPRNLSCAPKYDSITVRH